MGRLAATAASAACLWLAPARAEFSTEWEAYAAETRAACDDFEASLTATGAPVPALASPGDGFNWPSGAPGRPHISLYYAFKAGADGKPVEIDLLFKGPDNLNYRFVRRHARNQGSPVSTG